MKNPKKLLVISLICLLGLSLTTCQKIDPVNEDQKTYETALKSIPVDLKSESNYLMSLISRINDMVNDQQISKGNANALITKLTNAITNIENGKPKIASNQLNALINNINSFIGTGVINIVQAQPLLNVAGDINNFLSGNPLISEGLISFYPFNGTANDGSGNNRTGVPTNISFLADRNGNLNSAAYFKGNSNVRIPAIGQINSSFSLAFWYKTIPGGTILSTDNIFMGAYSPGNMFINSWNTSIGTYSPAGMPGYFNNSWHHVVVTHDGNTGTIVTYFDGIVKHIRPNSGYFLGNMEDIYVGAVVKEYSVQFPYVNSFFTGSIDEMYFFNRAISAAEVQKLFSYPRLFSGPLVNTTWDFTVNYDANRYWHADVTFYADGTTIYDEPDSPGVYTMYGTWSMAGNVLHYIMDSSGRMGTNYNFTGTLSGSAMSGTFTLGNGTSTWSAVLK